MIDAIRFTLVALIQMGFAVMSYTAYQKNDMFWCVAWFLCLVGVLWLVVEVAKETGGHEKQSKLQGRFK